MNRATAYQFSTAEGHRFSGARDASGHGHLHSFDDEPAVIYADGSQWWYENGNVSRRGDKPAVVWANGVVEYWIDGVRQREGGPAVIFSADDRVHPDVRGARQFWEHGVMVRMER